MSGLYYFSDRGQILIWDLFFTLYSIEQSLTLSIKWAYSLMFEAYEIFILFLIRFIQQTSTIYFFVLLCYLSFFDFLDEASWVKIIDFWLSAITFQSAILEIIMYSHSLSSLLLFLDNTRHLSFAMLSPIKSDMSVAFFIFSLFFEHFFSGF